MVKDLIRGRLLEPQNAYGVRTHQGHTFYFCSQDYVDQFDVGPYRYDVQPGPDQAEARPAGQSSKPDVTQ